VLQGLGLPSPAESLGAGRSLATLDGRLRASDPNAATRPGAVSFHPYGTSFLDEPNVYAATRTLDPSALVVELDDGARARLDGPVQVLVGSVESEHAAPLDRAESFGAAELASARSRARTGQFRSVRDGDRVRVRGIVERAPDDDALYRERSRAFRVTPELDDAPGATRAITIASTTTPTRRRVGPRPLRFALAGAAAFGLVLPFVAPAEIKGGGGAKDRPVAAAVTPNPHPPCRDEARQAIERNDFGDAARAAGRCNDPWTKGTVEFLSGDFAQASASFAEATKARPDERPSLSEIETHLFAHQYERAAAVAHRMITVFYPGPSTAEKRYLECISGLLDARAEQVMRGGDGPYAYTRSHKRYRKICSTRPFARLARELEAEGAYWGEEDWLDFSGNGEVYRMAAAYDAVGQPFTAAVAPRDRLAARPVGLEALVVERLLLRGSPGRADHAPHAFGRLDVFPFHKEDHFAKMTALTAELALFYGHAGFPDRAKRLWPILDQVAALLEAKPERSFHVVETEFPWEKKMVEDERTMLSSVMSVAAAAAVFSGEPARATRYANVGEPYSGRVAAQLGRARQERPTWEEPFEDGHWPDRQKLFATRLSGDAAEAAKLLGEAKSTGRDTLPRLLPFLPRNRAALDEWFDKGFPAPCVDCGATIMLGHLADRWDVARMLHRRKTEEELRWITTRFTDALTDPEVAFEIEELETFFASQRR
jgi:hypothetical protein